MSKIIHGNRKLQYNIKKTSVKNFNTLPKGGNDGYKQLENIMKNNDLQTIVLGDGINYPINAATIVRNGSILGLTTFILAPIPKDVYIETKKENPEYADAFLSPFKIQDGNCIYTNKFIKAVEKYSTQHQDCLNLLYNCDPDIVIDLALKNGFTIFMMENDVKGDIFDKDMTHKKILFVVGNERYGVRDSIRQLYPAGKIQPLYIPSCLDRSSMNVAMAATIAIYERAKQARCQPTKCENNLLLNLIPSQDKVDRN